MQTLDALLDGLNRTAEPAAAQAIADLIGHGDEAELAAVNAIAFAAVLALMGRDSHLPRSVFQLLLYPAVDLAAEAGSYARVPGGRAGHRRDHALLH